MHPKFPLNDLILRRVEIPRKVASPVYADNTWQINQNEFAMQVEGVGSFYACNGNEVEYSTIEGTSEISVELYLNGSIYGAILHQRNILPLHGSSFIWNGQGIIICGKSGAGKSSLTASFCLNGATFLTDDVTPIQFFNNEPQIWAMSDRIKLWNDSLEQMNLKKEGLNKILTESDKYYLN